jgi:hypothetical protein
MLSPPDDDHFDSTKKRAVLQLVVDAPDVFAHKHRDHDERCVVFDGVF